MFNLSKKNLFTGIFLISFIALISAYFIEYVLGHQPCNLCVYERIPYFLAILIVLINYKYNKLEKYLILSLAIIFLIATILSLYHLGIEQGFIQESLLCDLEKGANIVDKDEILTVFVPTTPNPTSGFLLFVPKEDVVMLKMSVENAAKLVISAGLVVPDYNGKIK